MISAHDACSKLRPCLPGYVRRMLSSTLLVKVKKHTEGLKQHPSPARLGPQKGHVGKQR